MNELDNHKIEFSKDAEYHQDIKERYENRQNTARQCRRLQYGLDHSSYFFNFISVATASYFVYSITLKYPIGWQILFAGLMIGVLLLNEFAKRYCINEGAEDSPAWFIALPFLIGVSFYASLEGGKRFTTEQANAPTVEYNLGIDSLNGQIAKIDSDIALWEKQTWNGKIVKEARQGKKELESTKNELIRQRTKLENRDLERNDTNETEHKAELRKYGNVFGVVAGCSDLVLLICLMIARGAEKKARRLFGLIAKDSVQSERPETGVQNRSREQLDTPAPNAPNLVPVPVSDPVAREGNQEGVNIELIKYAQRIAPNLAEIKEVKKESAELKDKVVQLTEIIEQQTEQLNTLKSNTKTEQLNTVQSEQKSNTKNIVIKKSKSNANLIARAKQMKGQNMSLRQIGKKLGKSPSTISTWLKS